MIYQGYIPGIYTRDIPIERQQKHKKHQLKRWALRALMSVRVLALVSKLPDAQPSHPSFLQNHLFIWQKHRFATLH